VSLTLWLACAAGEPTDYDGVRATCGLAEGEYVATPWGEAGAIRTISTPCAEAIAAATSLEWDTFSADPIAGVQTPDGIGEAVIGALFTLLAADTGTVAELAYLAGEDEALTELLAELQADAPIDDAAPAGVVPWRWLTERVDAVSWDERNSNASFAMDRVVVSILDEDVEEVRVVPAALAAIFVHEIAHDVAGAHTAGRAADADPNGAYGAHARWLWMWLDENAGAVDAADCANVAEMLDRKCGQIEDTSGFMPCDDVGWCE
jgi:hypothetical protein